MPLDPAQYRQIADELWSAAASSGTTAAPTRRFSEFSIDDGYAVGSVLAERRLSGGDLRAGVKIGFTNTEVWDEFGLDFPICAPIYKSSVFSAEALGGRFDISRMVEPRIEPEVVFGIGEGGIDWWALGFEIVQCHYPKWELRPSDAIADYGLHAALIIGDPKLFTPTAAAASASFTVELLCDGELVERGAAKDVLGGPLRSLERLIELATRIGMDLPSPGEVVTTGSLTPAPFIKQGERWSVTPSGADLPALSVQFGGRTGGD